MHSWFPLTPSRWVGRPLVVRLEDRILTVLILIILIFLFFSQVKHGVAVRNFLLYLFLANFRGYHFAYQYA
jgi:hypothetical protein